MDVIVSIALENRNWFYWSDEIGMIDDLRLFFKLFLE